MLNWVEYSFCARWNVAIYEPREIAVIATPDIFEKAEHQNEDTGTVDKSSVLFPFRFYRTIDRSMVHLLCVLRSG